MRKLLAMVLASVMVLSFAACSAPATTAATEAATEAVTEAATQAATEAATEAVKEAPAEIINVDYYCSVGAYLITLQNEVDKWNEGEGKEKGVYLNIISNINSYTQDLTALLEAGTHYDLMDVGTANPAWVEKGYVQDLDAIDDPELKELIQSYSAYLKKGTNYQQGVLTGLPLEVVPLKFACNVDLFEKNNLEYPKTWDDVVECAKVITENGKGAAPNGGDAYGFGGTTWSGMFQRLVVQSSLNSVGKTWWDPNTETYDWAPFKKPLECVKEMYENGWILGMDDLAIDPHPCAVR